VDTAPTGHTLRLLALPKFLDGFLGKLIELRMKLSGFASTLQAFFGSNEAAQRTQTIDNALEKIESFRNKMAALRNMLSDSAKTNFLIVTVPTTLGVAESKRLFVDLSEQDICVSDIIVNQCAVSDSSASEIENLQSMKNMYERRKAGQQKCLQTLTDVAKDVSCSDEYQRNGDSSPISVTQIPFFDVELVGTAALTYLGTTCYKNNPSFSHLMGSESMKVVICGGKGGVGKTTTSSAVAMAMAESGHKVALISTDPAHSLGDAIAMDLSGGSLIDCPTVGLSSGGSLSVMEVDPSNALTQFKKVIDDLVGTGSSGSRDASASGIGSTLRELGEVFDTLPAGTDEVVALAKVIGVIRNGGFDRVVLDTAPTGHTLRMLTTPAFLADLIDRILVIARKVNSNPTVKMMISGAATNEDELNAAAAKAKSTLQSFQVQMFDLEDLFSDATQTEFLIVTILTELAVRESKRLLNDLTFEAPDMPIKVRNIVANQVLRDDEEDIDSFISRVQRSQDRAIKDLQNAVGMSASTPDLLLVPFVDTEPRGVFGLKVIAESLVQDTSDLALKEI